MSGAGVALNYIQGIAEGWREDLAAGTGQAGYGCTVSAGLLTAAGYFGSQPSEEHLRGFCPPWIDRCPGESCFRGFLLIVGERF